MLSGGGGGCVVIFLLGEERKRSGRRAEIGRAEREMAGQSGRESRGECVQTEPDRRDSQVRPGRMETPGKRPAR